MALDKARVVEILKEEGMDLGEEMACVAIKAVFKALPRFIVESENKYDDMLLPVLGLVEPKVLELADKIDGQVG